MKHIHKTGAFLIKSGILRKSVYNVCGSQQLICRTCQKGIHSAHAQSCANIALYNGTPRICGSENLARDPRDLAPATARAVRLFLYRMMASEAVRVKSTEV